VTLPRIWLSPPDVGAREQEMVADAFRSNWIAPLGPHVDGFEAELCEVTGAKYAAALSSGTAAIHIALILLGVERDDVVICQDLTFSGTVNPIVYLGARPVFIDSEKETWNMDPELLREAVRDSIARGKKPKAIIPVHLYGMPAKMHEVNAIAREFGMPVIEDAAEALGSRFDGDPCGDLGDIGILSFNGNKIVTTSGGGALLSDRKDLVDKARFLATQARDPAPHYQHSQIGYNYRMSNVLAAIGRGQLSTLEQRVQARRANFERYRDFFRDIEGVTLLEEPRGSRSNRWLTTIQVDPSHTGGLTRKTVRLALEQQNIEARPLWKPMHMQPVFEPYPSFGGSVAERLFDRGLCLPSGSNLRDEDFDRILSALSNVFHSPRDRSSSRKAPASSTVV
jgi:dTDP-4-amino-4,6-dideoxygalactose transaminase